MADIVLTQGESLPAGTKITYKDMGDGTYALVLSAASSAMDADVAAIKAVTDLLPNDGALTDIGTDAARLTAVRAATLTDWIDGGRLDLLLDLVLANINVPTADSIANALMRDVLGNKSDVASEAATASVIALLRELLAEVDFTDEHNHNVERWWGATGAPDETNAIAATVTVPFAATSGNNTWGTAIPILGTADNPVLAGMTLFDPHRVSIIDLDADTTPWRLRFIYGSGTSAAAISAEQWSEIPTITNATPGNRAGGVAENIRMIPLPIGTKLWAQSWNDTADEILQFFWGAHGYPAPTFP